MRCLVETVRSASGWTVSYTDPATKKSIVPNRVLVACSEVTRFPRVVEHAAEQCHDATHALCEDSTGLLVQRAFDRVGQLEVSAEHVQVFGRYLTQAILGGNWTALQAVAGAEPIELELAFVGDDCGLAALPWEIMHDVAGEPLGAQRGRKVAIARIVDPGNAAEPMPSIKLPLRVLFIVGRQVDDQLRPGAELIGLLRRIQLPVNAQGTQFETSDLNVRYLSEAT